MAQKNRSVRPESSNVSTSLAANGRSEASSTLSFFAFIKERVDFLTYAREHLDLKQAGQNFLGRCPHPDHEDRNPSCIFYLAHAHCFSCGYHGDVIDLHGCLNNIESPYQATQSLCEERGLEVAAYSAEARQIADKCRQRAGELLAEAQKRYDALRNYPKVAWYWESRGFDSDLQSRYLLGADEDGTATIPFWNRNEVYAALQRVPFESPGVVSMILRTPTIVSSYPLDIVSPMSVTLSDIHLARATLRSCSCTSVENSIFRCHLILREPGFIYSAYHAAPTHIHSSTHKRCP